MPLNIKCSEWNYYGLALKQKHKKHPFADASASHLSLVLWHVWLQAVVWISHAASQTPPSYEVGGIAKRTINHSPSAKNQPRCCICLLLFADINDSVISDLQRFGVLLMPLNIKCKNYCHNGAKPFCKKSCIRVGEIVNPNQITRSA